MRARYGLLCMVALLLAGCSAQGSHAKASPLGAVPSKAPLRIVRRLSAQMPQVAPPQGNVATLSMVAPRTGFAVAAPASGGPGQILYSSDGGLTWQVRAKLKQQVTALQFISANVGFAVTPDALLATADGGRTWTTRDSLTFSQVRFVSPLDGVATTQAGELVTTADGGLMWLPALSAPGLYFSSVSALPGPIYFALGGTQGSGQSSQTSLYVSRDGGAQWTRLFEGVLSPPLQPAYEAYLKAQLPSGLQQYPNFGQGGSVTFTTPSDGWVSLLDGGFLATMVLHTTDGGRTWSYAWGNGGCAMGCNGAGGGLYPAAYLGSQYAWRYDGQGIDRSSNGGETFVPGGAVPLSIPPSNGVRSLQFLTPDLGVAATSYGILRTTDGGNSWQRVWPLGPGPLRSVSMTASGYGFAVSVNQPDLLLRTGNGGRTWQPLRSFPYAAAGSEAPEPQISSIWAFSGGRGLVYAGGRLYRTSDRGGTWQIVPLRQPPAAPYSQATILFSSLSDGWAVSIGLDSGNLYRTTDGGRTWIKASRLQVGPTACQELSARIGWCLNGRKDPRLPPGDWTSRLLVTTDGGRHFTEVGSLPLVSSATSISFATPSAGALLGANQVLITQDAGRTFTQLEIPGIDLLSQVDAVTPHEIYVVSGEGQLFVTRDGGKVWHELL